MSSQLQVQWCHIGNLKTGCDRCIYTMGIISKCYKSELSHPLPEQFVKHWPIYQNFLPLGWIIQECAPQWFPDFFPSRIELQLPIVITSLEIQLLLAAFPVSVLYWVSHSVISFPWILGSLFSFLFFWRFYSFIHDTQRERGRDIDRGRSSPPVGSLMQDSIPGRQDHALSGRQTLNHWAT